MKKIKLKSPVTIDGASVSEIALRDPNMNDIFNSGMELLQPDKMTAKQINALIANLANWTPDQVGTLAPGDWLKASNHVVSFLS